MTSKVSIILLHAVAVDGDTITAGGTAVRLWGVDAPELETAAGPQGAGPQGAGPQGAGLLQSCKV